MVSHGLPIPKAEIRTTCHHYQAYELYKFFNNTVDHLESIYNVHDTENQVKKTFDNQQSKKTNIPITYANTINL